MSTVPSNPMVAPPAPPNSGQRRRPVWILIAVFILGLIAGGGGGVWLAPRIHHNLTHHERYIRHMTQMLNLTPAQAQQFRSIVADAEHHWRQIHQQLEPQYHALFEQELRDFTPIRAQERNRVRAMLNPQQQAKFNAWVQHWDQQHATAHPHPASSGRRDP